MRPLKGGSRPDFHYRIDRPHSFRQRRLQDFMEVLKGFCCARAANTPIGSDARVVPKVLSPRRGLSAVIEHALETFVLSPPHSCTSDNSEARSLSTSLA